MGISINDHDQFRLRYEFLGRDRKAITDAKTKHITNTWGGNGPSTITDEWAG